MPGKILTLFLREINPSFFVSYNNQYGATGERYIYGACLFLGKLVIKRLDDIKINRLGCYGPRNHDWRLVLLQFVRLNA